MSPRGIQPDCGFFSDDEKQESKQIEDLSPDGAIISNQAPEGEISTIVVIKFSDEIKWTRVKVDGPLCGGLYKEDHGSIIIWSGTYPDANINSFTWYKEENDRIVLGYQYNKDFNNWQGPIKMVNYANRTSRRRKIHRRHALSIQYLSSLLGFLGKESQQYPSSPTWINAVNIR